jgi:hypothetical protein
VPKVVERPVHGQLAALLSALAEIVALENPDAILRRSVEVARGKIGLARAAIFLLDGPRQMMLGTWGCDLQGNVVDEHRIMFSLETYGSRSVPPRPRGRGPLHDLRRLSDRRASRARDARRGPRLDRLDAHRVVARPDRNAVQ